MPSLLCREFLPVWAHPGMRGCLLGSETLQGARNHPGEPPLLLIPIKAMGVCGSARKALTGQELRPCAGPGCSSELHSWIRIHLLSSKGTPLERGWTQTCFPPSLVLLAPSSRGTGAGIPGRWLLLELSHCGWSWLEGLSPSPGGVVVSLRTCNRAPGEGSHHLCAFTFCPSSPLKWVLLTKQGP